MVRRTALVLIVAAVGAGAAAADVKLPAIIDSHMVLQRDVPLTIWGWAEPGESVAVKLGESSADTKADDKGNWQVTLPAQKADGKPRHLTVTGQNRIERSDILIGEVWLGSGQSNMEWSLLRSHAANETIAAAVHPQVRLFQTPRTQATVPAKDVKGQWAACSPKSVANFSAVLYHFGVKLQKELEVPIGLIHSSWGGSAIEPWTIKGTASGGMYNGMIAPLTPFALRGTIWYQGETNALQKNGLAYADKMRDLIEGWRKVWGADFPFYFVQIAPWQPDKGGYPPGELQALWEAQCASLKIPHTGMVVVTDLVDNVKDIHPGNKRDVGLRLARWALAKTYGRKDVVFSGPLYRSMKIEGNKIRLSFAHAAGGLKARDEQSLREFEIAGDDDKFVPALAVIDGESVIVSSPNVAKPTQARFGWSNIAHPNLTNQAGLPASPFRTKNWTGGTGE